MKKINLLPHEVQKAKDVRRIAIIIAAVQAAIFVSALLLYVFFSMLQSRQSQEIESLIRQQRQNPSMPAQTWSFPDLLHEEFLTIEAFENVQTASDGIWLYAIRFEHGNFNITARATDILYIQAHIEALSEYFNDIRLVNLLAANYGYYVFELNLSSR